MGRKHTENLEQATREGAQHMVKHLFAMPFTKRLSFAWRLIIVPWMTALTAKLKKEK